MRQFFRRAVTEIIGELVICPLCGNTVSRGVATPGYEPANIHKCFRSDQHQIDMKEKSFLSVARHGYFQKTEMRQYISTHFDSRRY